MNARGKSPGVQKAKPRDALVGDSGLQNGIRLKGGAEDVRCGDAVEPGSEFVDVGTGVFKTPGNQQPVFSQWFPTLNFNPPPANVANNTSGVTVDSRPFVDLTTDVNGSYNGMIIAQGNGFQAGVGLLHHFNGVFTGKFLVTEAGPKTFHFFTLFRWRWIHLGRGRRSDAGERG